MSVHPNLVKRPQRARSTMVGRNAFYVPISIMTNTDIPKGSRVTIMEFEHKSGKELSLVRVKTDDGTETTALFSDLAFIE